MLAWGGLRLRRVAARLILRLAIVAASLAWAGFVFTHTVGDPERGERVAEAVLDDDAARAEIVTPITAAVIRSTGVPADQQSLIAAGVDQLLRQPDGARVFIDTFAGRWARMLGEDDPRRSEVDIAPLVEDLVATTPGLDAATLPTDQVVAASVPLPRTNLPWLGGLRRAIAASTVPLALAAAVGFATAFAFGDRRWVLRRIGIWAALAGATWVVMPALVVWAARRWAPGADAVVSVAVEEAVSGLRPAAIVLLTSGVAAFAASFAPAVAPSPAEPEMPAVRRQSTAPSAPRRPPHDHTTPVRATATPTVAMPDHVVRPAATRPTDDEHDPDDALWKFYS